MTRMVVFLGWVVLGMGCGDGSSSEGSAYRLSLAPGTADMVGYTGSVDLIFEAPGNQPAGTRPPVFSVLTGNTRITPAVGTFALDVSLTMAEGFLDTDGVSLFAGFTLDPTAPDWNSFLAGSELPVGCRLYWQDWRTDVFVTWSTTEVTCRVKRAGVGYRLAIDSAVVTDDEGGVLLARGTVDLGPAPTEVTSFTPSGACDSAHVCLVAGTAVEERSELGYCFPRDNLLTSYVTCDGGQCSEGQPVTIERAGIQHCLCLRPCGKVPEFGEAAPVCDPAYGCIFL